MKREFGPDVRAMVRYRAWGNCEICKTEPMVHFHHRLRRSQGGEGSLANCLGLCPTCHDHVHANPGISYANGWLLHAEPVNMGLKP